jgi:hypothetical protein
MSNITQDAVIGAILDGLFDGDEGALYDAIKQRQRLADARKRLSFRKGDKVRFNGTASPKYLIGAEATVERVKATRVDIVLSATVGRFPGGPGSAPIPCPVGIIEKV